MSSAKHAADSHVLISPFSTADASPLLGIEHAWQNSGRNPNLTTGGSRMTKDTPISCAKYAH